MDQRLSGVLYDDSQLPSDCLAYAEKQLGETKTIREETLREITNWINENPQLNINSNDIVYLMHFLRGTKFRIEKTKNKMKRYYTMRLERVEWFKNRNPFRPEIEELLDLGVFLPLKVKDDQNRQIFIIRTAAHDPQKHTQNDVLKVGKMLLDLVLHLDETISVYGLVAIFDMKGVTLSHALQLPPQLIKRSVESWESYPCLTKKLEFVNAPIYINAVLNTFRFFMSTKLKSRVSATKGTSTVNALLPTDLGGCGESYKELATYWKKQAQEKSNWYHEMEEFRNCAEVKCGEIKNETV